jgi:hypothetical protein
VRLATRCAKASFGDTRAVDCISVLAGWPSSTAMTVEAFRIVPPCVVGTANVDLGIDPNMKQARTFVLACFFSCGAAGNRTRVLRHSLEASPCAVRYASTRIS